MNPIARRPQTMQTMPGNQISSTGVVAAVISTPLDWTT
jgi:hypothetical protein